MQLRPVRFQYKDEYAKGDQLPQYGLIAEEVAEVFPDLVQYEDDGKPEGVRYHVLNVLLLNELQKQQRTIHQQQKQIAEQRATISDLQLRLTKLEAHVMH